MHCVSNESEGVIIITRRQPTLMPCMRDMARSGRSALSVLMVLKAWMPPAPSSEAVKLISDTCNVLVVVLVVELSMTFRERVHIYIIRRRPLQGRLMSR